MTTKPSERIVVFVTPAQKLAISNTAESLGISASELMRRAVMSFDATSEQVKVAGIVDRLHAPRAPDPLNVALRQVAERAAAREARDAAQVAKAAARRAPKVLPAQAVSPAAGQSFEVAQPLQAANAAAGEAANAAMPAAPEVPAQALPATCTSRVVTQTPAPEASALAKAPQPMSMKTSIALHPFNVARFVKS